MMKLGELIEKIEAAENDVFWRIGNKNVNIFKTQSVEIPKEHLQDSIDHAGSLEQLTEDMEKYGCYYDKNGHLGEGFYWDGVCCARSLGSLARYFHHIPPCAEDNAVFVFEGDVLDSCTDGVVAKPIKIIEILHVDVIRDRYLCEHL